MEAGKSRDQKIEDIVSRLVERGALHNSAIAASSLALYSYGNAISERLGDSRYISLAHGLVNRFKRSREHIDFGPNSISQKEINRFLTFVLAMGETMHSGHRRATGKPYIIHPVKANMVLGSLKKEISYVSSASIMLHDVPEERADSEHWLLEGAAAESVPPGEPSARRDAGEYVFRHGVLQLQLGLEMLDYVRSDERIKSKRELYRGIYSIGKIVTHLTRRKGMSYAEYQNRYIFNIRPGSATCLDRLLSGLEDKGCGINTPLLEKTAKALGQVGKPRSQAKVEELVMFYYRNVYKPHSSQDLQDKISRRIKMAKLAEIGSNMEDARRREFDFETGFTVPERIYKFFKGFMLIHATAEIYSNDLYNARQELEKAKKRRAKRKEIRRITKDIRKVSDNYSKIIPLALYVGRAVTRNLGEDRRYVLERMQGRKGSRAMLGAAATIDSRLSEYMKSRHSEEITDRSTDRSMFAGTFDYYLRLLEQKRERFMPEHALVKQYKHLTLLYEIFSRFLENFRNYRPWDLESRAPFIDRMSLDELETKASYLNAQGREHGGNADTEESYACIAKASGGL